MKEFDETQFCVPDSSVQSDVSVCRLFPAIFTNKLQTRVYYFLFIDPILGKKKEEERKYCKDGLGTL